jgi:hypothetical protein
MRSATYKEANQQALLPAPRADASPPAQVAAPTSKVEKDDASQTMMDKCKAVAAAAQVKQDQAQMALVEAKDDADPAVAWLLDQREQQEQQARPKAAAPMARTQRGKTSNGGVMPDTAGQQQEQQPSKQHSRSSVPQQQPHASSRQAADDRTPRPSPKG